MPPTPLLFVPDFSGEATETLTWATGITLAFDGTERRRSHWSQPQREYEQQVSIAPGFNDSVLVALRAHPASVLVPLWCFSGTPPLAGLAVAAGQQFAHYDGGFALATTGTPATPAGYAETAPMVAGYLAEDVKAHHQQDDIGNLRLRVRVPPFEEDLTAGFVFIDGEGLAHLPDFTHWNEGTEESLKRTQDEAAGNSALYAIEQRYGERFIALNLAMHDDVQVRRLRAFLFHIKGAGEAFRFDAIDGERTWRLAQDEVAITYHAGGGATCSLTLKDLTA